MPNHLVLGFLVQVIAVQVWGKYMIIGYLDPQGKGALGLGLDLRVFEGLQRRGISTFTAANKGT